MKTLIQPFIPLIQRHSFFLRRNSDLLTIYVSLVVLPLYFFFLVLALGIPPLHGLVDAATFVLVLLLCLPVIAGIAATLYTERVAVYDWFAQLGTAFTVKGRTGGKDRRFIHNGREFRVTHDSGKQKSNIREWQSFIRSRVARNKNLLHMLEVRIATQLEPNPGFAFTMLERTDYKAAEFPNPEVRFNYRFDFKDSAAKERNFNDPDFNSRGLKESGLQARDPQALCELFADPELRLLLGNVELTTSFVIRMENGQLALYKLFNQETVEATLAIFHVLDRLALRIEQYERERIA